MAATKRAYITTSLPHCVFHLTPLLFQLLLLLRCCFVCVLQPSLALHMLTVPAGTTTTFMPDAGCSSSSAQASALQPYATAKYGYVAYTSGGHMATCAYSVLCHASLANGLHVTCTILACPLAKTSPGMHVAHLWCI
jgi:hypothetical protein